MAAGPDYKDDDDDDHDDGEYSPTNRSEHSYELYVEGAGRGHADPGSGVLPPHRRMSVFTEEDEEEALAAAAAEQEGRDRRVSGTKADKSIWEVPHDNHHEVTGIIIFFFLYYYEIFRKLDTSSIFQKVKLMDAFFDKPSMCH